MDEQQKNGDLQQQIAKARGIRKVELLHQQVKELYLDNPLQALQIADEARALALHLLLAQWKKDGRNTDRTDAHTIAGTAVFYPDYTLAVADNYLRTGRCHTFLPDCAMAEVFFDDALQLYRVLQNYNGELEVLRSIVRIRLRSGTYRSALDMCMQALAICDNVTDPDLVILMLVTTADVYYSLMQHESALLYYQRALEIVARTGIDRSKSSVLCGIGMTYCGMGRNDEALIYLQQSLGLVREAGDNRAQANVLLHLARVYWGLGEYQQALDVNREAMTVCELIDDKLNICYLCVNIANIYLVLGDYGTSCDYYNKALEISTAGKNAHGQAAAVEGMGILYAEWKEYATAIEYCSRVMHLYEQAGDTSGMAVIVGNMGIIFQRMGDREKAREYFQRFRMLNLEIEFPEGEITACYNLGDMHFADADYAQAEYFYAQGLAISERIQSRSKIFKGRYLLGRAYIGQGKNDQALQCLCDVLENAAGLQEKHLLLDIHKELSELFEKSGSYERAFFHYKAYHSVEKEIFSNESHERVKKIQVLHRVEQAEKEREIYRITSENLLQENEGQKKELASKAMFLSQKNELLGRIKKTLRSIAQKTDPQTSLAIKSVVSDVEGTLADDQTWSLFEEQFQKIQQPFMQALIERYPSLSPLEVRVCALIRLSSKEVSRILNVAPRSVEMYRYRIRKKIVVGAADNLNSFLLRLEHT